MKVYFLLHLLFKLCNAIFTFTIVQAALTNFLIGIAIILRRGARTWLFLVVFWFIFYLFDFCDLQRAFAFLLLFLNFNRRTWMFSWIFLLFTRLTSILRVLVELVQNFFGTCLIGIFNRKRLILIGWKELVLELVLVFFNVFLQSLVGCFNYFVFLNESLCSFPWVRIFVNSDWLGVTLTNIQVY